MAHRPVPGILTEPTPQEQLLRLLEDGQSYSVEELVARAPHISWAQLFNAMDQLSRCGSVEIRRHGFTYVVRKAEPSLEGSGRADASAHPDRR